MTEDTQRELHKVYLALVEAENHLALKARSNAVLHCATEVLYPPLHSRVQHARATVERLLGEALNA